jgi:hypothetical protein
MNIKYTMVIDKINKQLTLLEHYIPLCHRSNSEVSAATIGWHIEHLQLVMKNIISYLRTTKESSYAPKRSLRKWLIFTFKTIPRGTAKAPKSTQPYGPITLEKLQKSLVETRAILNSIGELKQNQHFNHPHFGNLNVHNTLQFFEIHNQHHIKIIKAILAG